MMREEIGSEFWSIPLASQKKTTVPMNAIWYLSGRSALFAIIDVLLKKKVKSISLPSWCCDSVINPFIQNGININFYDVCGKKQYIDCIDTDALFIMDYFGYGGYSFVPKEYNGVVIRDVTHTFFSSYPNDADFYFASLRKWCGFWTGGLAWGKEMLPIPENECIAFSNYRQFAMETKSEYMSFKIETKDYLSAFGKAELMLDQLSGFYLPSSRDIELFEYLDVDYIKSKRRQNAKLIMDELGEYCVFDDFSESDCPLFVPIRVKNRNQLKSYLIDMEIFCPSHWPLTANHAITKEQAQIYKEELSLICDQRYGENEMHRLICAVKEGIRYNA